MKIPFKIPVSFKNRTAIGAVIIIAAIIFGFVLVPLVSNVSSASVTVVRAKQDIPVGTKITGDMLETISEGKKGLPDNVLNNLADVVGKYAAVGITAQDDITVQKLSSAGSIYKLKDGQQLISVAVKNFADSLSGKLQAGDIVSVYFPPAAGNSITNSAQTSAQCPPELQYVKVAAVTAASGSDTDAAQVQKSASSANNDNNLPATVTLIVNERQAQIIAGQENNAVHLALACRGDDDKAQQLLTKQADYFKQNNSSLSSSSSSASSSSTNSSQVSQNVMPSTSDSSLDTSSNLGAVK